jgi:general stress protein 26
MAHSTNYTIRRDENLEFIINKIQEIKIAMFRAEASSIQCPPNNIITTLKTDNDGNIWFLTSCNKDYAKNIDKCFFASLDYYQKGTDCRLRISGSASIAENAVEAPVRVTKKDKEHGILLIKLKILNAEYYENKHVTSASLKEQLKFFFHKMFYAPEYRQYDFSETI